MNFFISLLKQIQIILSLTSNISRQKSFHIIVTKLKHPLLTDIGCDSKSTEPGIVSLISNILYSQILVVIQKPQNQELFTFLLFQISSLFYFRILILLSEMYCMTCEDFSFTVFMLQKTVYSLFHVHLSFLFC